MNVRKPAVAGRFYPSDPEELRRMVRGFLDAVEAPGPAPKAMIAPHAGFIYSGPVAATAYKRLEASRGQITRVVLFGPSHRVRFHGLALSSADAFETPLGLIPVGADATASVSHLPQVRVLDQAHALEHSLEVHLPFLQETLGHFSLI